jgi:hypothetical protein
MTSLRKNGGQVGRISAPGHRVVVGLIPGPEPGFVQAADHGRLDSGPLFSGQPKVNVSSQLRPCPHVAWIASLGWFEPGETACGQD